MAEEEEVLDRGDFIEEVEDEEEESEEVEVEEEVEDEEDEGEGEDEPSEEDEDGEEEAETPDEDEEVESEDPDEDEDEEEPDSDGNQRVPRSRLNQVIQQREEEKERSAWLEEQLSTLIKQRQEPEVVEEAPAEVPSYDFDTSEAKYIELVLEGSIDDAGKLRREINQERDKIYDHQLASVKASLSEEVKASSENTRTTAKFEDFLEDTFASKEYLDDTNDAYNEQAVQMANRLMIGYMQEGKDKIEALDQAVKDISPMFEEKPSLGKKSPSKRTVSARKKAVSASEAQPPSTENSGGKKSARDLDKINISKMSEKAFNSLTKKELATLRGD